MLIRQDSSVVALIVLLERIRDKWEPKETLVCEGFEELTKRLNPNIPVCIVVSGKGVLFTQFDAESERNDDILLNKILPNARLEDFYFQRILFNENENWFTVIRVSSLKAITEQFEKNNFPVVRIGLGPFDIDAVLNAKLREKKSFQAGTYFFEHVEPGSFRFSGTGFNETPESSEMSDHKLETRFILAFATALRFLNDGKTGVESQPPIVRESYIQFLSFKAYQVLLPLSLGVLFVLLLGNFFAFTRLQNKEAQYAATLQAYLPLINELEETRSILTKRKILVRQSRITGRDRISYYIDRLVSVMPEILILEEISVFPFKKRSLSNEIPQAENKILIRGKTRNSQFVNNWIDSLKNFDWISDVNLLGLTQDSIDGSTVFVIDIRLSVVQ